MTIAKTIVLLSIALMALAILGCSNEPKDGFAEHMRAMSYYEGRGVSQDHEEAMKWFRLAAKRGSADAQCQLGIIYYNNGFADQQNRAEAMKWFRLAAERGHRPAQGILGGIYWSGKTTPRDYIQAYFWFTLMGDWEACRLVGLEMTADQIVEARRLAREWKPK